MSQDPDAALLEAAAPVYGQLGRMEKKSSGLLKQVVVEIRDSLFTQKYTVTQLLAAIGVSRSIVRSFRSTFGMTPRELIFEARISTAARLLSGTSISVEEIAFLVGWDVSTLRRAMLRWCGLNPSLFRAHAQEVGELLRQLPDDVMSPEFWDRVRNGQLNRDELLVMIRHYEATYDLSPEDC